MGDKHKEVEEIESSSGDSFIDDESYDDEPSTSGQDEGLHLEAPLTEEEIEDLISEFLEVESKAAEAQESLEKESLVKVEREVKEELAQTLHGDNLEMAVANEMEAFREECEAVLDELETESAHLLEQLDGAGIELPNLYKWIESQAPNGCCTEAWKKRTHWAGSQVTSEITESISDAEKFLQTHRPVRKRHGKLLEEGASGYLGKKLANNEDKEAITENGEVEWSSFNKLFSDRPNEDRVSFGSKHWASVYLASTPQQAAIMGLKFPGVDEVEEIDDIDCDSSDPFVADAIANERELDLSENQKRNFRKIKEEDDAIVDQKLQFHLKRRRRRRCKQEVFEQEACSVDQTMQSDLQNGIPVNVTSNDLEKESQISNGTSSVPLESALPGLTEAGSCKRSHEEEEPDLASKKGRTVVIDSDEGHVEDTVLPISEVTKMEDAFQTNGDDSALCQNLTENFHCTACDKVTTEVYQHPLLKVLVCRNCKILLEEKMHMKDSGFSEGYCGWCGRSSDLMSCTSCKNLFCALCIKRNIGEEWLFKIQSSGWQCCCCTPRLLQHLTLDLDKAIESGIALMSSSDSESDSSDAGIDILPSNRRKQKKKIRRILDDAELGEETKRKIAIEKERQERLKSLQVQFSTKSNMMHIANINGNLSEEASLEVLGDAATGYIVNVARESGEEAVRIPPSISSKLKAHQIAGIRFMWENIIQSVRNVKSGDKGLGCILAHTMGLGKTFQVIAFLYTAMRSVDLGLKTALIVTPVNVLHNWRHEFIKWRPSELKPLRVFMLEDVIRERRSELLAKWRLKGGVFLIGYTAFRNLSLGKHVKDRHMARDICHALQEGPDILVCDEAHMIKNTRADITQALKQVKCQRRIALTGSPLQNNLMEYYCMVDFVREGFLGSSHEFRNRFQNPIENGQHTNSTSEDVKIMNQRSHILYEQLKGFVQRMDMNVVKKDLPPKTVFVIAVKLSPLQRKLYKRFLDVHGFTMDKVPSEQIRKRSFFAGYQALAQIWNHPGILELKREYRDYVQREDAVENFLAEDTSSDDNDSSTVTGDKQRNKSDAEQRKNVNGFYHEGWWNGLLHQNYYKEIDYSGKMVLLIDILTLCCQVGDKVLVFSQSLPTLDLIEFYLSKLPRQGRKGKYWKQGKDWYRLDGSTEGSERQKLVERFNEPLNKRVKCTLISTRAGSLGINLHAANRVIIVDGSWNPTYDLQAIYRVWRYGQTKPVFAYRLMAHGTMEEKIYKRQVTKEGLAARVVDRQQVHRTMSREEMLHLFEFGDDENTDTLLESNGHDAADQNVAGQMGILPKVKLPISHGSCLSDKLMETLVGRHHPRWIANYHEHETLLQENEEEKLSKEEQDKAWEVYKRTFEWEEVNRNPIGETSVCTSTQKANATVVVTEKASRVVIHSKTSLRTRLVQRKCTNLAHLLTLRSQGTKVGCSTVCGECAQEISWETLNRDNRSSTR